MKVSLGSLTHITCLRDLPKGECTAVVRAMPNLIGLELCTVAEGVEAILSLERLETLRLTVKGIIFEILHVGLGQYGIK